MAGEFLSPNAPLSSGPSDIKSQTIWRAGNGESQTIIMFQWRMAEGAVLKLNLLGGGLRNSEGCCWEWNLGVGPQVFVGIRRACDGA